MFDQIFMMMYYFVILKSMFPFPHTLWIATKAGHIGCPLPDIGTLLTLINCPRLCCCRCFNSVQIALTDPQPFSVALVAAFRPPPFANCPFYRFYAAISLLLATLMPPSFAYSHPRLTSPLLLCPLWTLRGSEGSPWLSSKVWGRKTIKLYNLLLMLISHKYVCFPMMIVTILMIV
jgi:hypothetical protein